jgi:predicted anti-sigma-YlaC factor YlaD
MSALRFGGAGGPGAGDMDCTRARELAPELALGVLDGAERAAVLAHVDDCAACRRDVAVLTELGELLLLLAPKVPPPAGFETSVLKDLAPVRRQRRRRRSRRVLSAVAAALLALVGVAGVAAALRGGGDTGPPEGERASDPTTTATTPTTAPIVERTAVMHASSSGRMVGHTIVRRSGDADAHAEVALDEPLRKYYADTAATGEHQWWLAVFDVSGFHTMYPISFDGVTSTVPLHDGPDEVASIAVVDETHRPWCQGELGPAGPVTQG